MKFEAIINEIKGDLKKGDEITLSGSHDVWTVGELDGEYFDIADENGNTGKLSVYNLGNVTKVPSSILEYMTPEQAKKECARYDIKIAKIKREMDGFKGNSRKGERFTQLQKELDRLQTAKRCTGGSYRF